jgi:hypothetical protein
MTGLTTALPFLRGAVLGLKQGVLQRHLLPDSFHVAQASFACSRVHSLSLQACSASNASTLYAEPSACADWLASSADAMNATISSSKVRTPPCFRNSPDPVLHNFALCLIIAFVSVATGSGAEGVGASIRVASGHPTSSSSTKAPCHRHEWPQRRRQRCSHQGNIKTIIPSLISL